MKNYILILFLVAAILLSTLSGIFIVNPKQIAIVSSRYSNELESYSSGLHYTYPFIKRIDYLFINQRSLLVTLIINGRYISRVNNSFYNLSLLIKWHIKDPYKYFHIWKKYTISGINQQIAQACLNKIIYQQPGKEFKEVLPSSINGYLVADLGIVVDKLLVSSIKPVDKQVLSLLQNNISADIKTASSATTEISGVNQSANKELLESAYYRVQEIKSRLAKEQVLMYESIENKNPRLYEYFRKLELFRDTVTNKADVPPLEKLY